MTGKFHGDGFSETPLDGKEAAQHRHMYNEVSEEWESIDAAATLVRAFSVVSNIVKVGTPITIFAIGFGAYAKAQGWM
jgi:hypothetical protein